MQRGVLLGAGAVAVLAIGFFGARSVTRQKAAVALDQGIDQLLTQLPPGYAIKHGTTDVNPLTRAVTVHDVTVTKDGAPVMLAETLTVAGADQRALSDVFDPAAYPQGHPAWTDRRLLIADATADRVQYPARPPQTGLVTVRSMTLHRLSGRPFAMPPTPQNRAQPNFGADAALAFALDSADLHDLAFVEQAPKQDRGSIAAITVSDYDAGKLGSAAIKQAAVQAPAQAGGKLVSITLDHIDVKDLDARAALESVRRTGMSDRTTLGKISYSSADAGGLAMHVPAGPRHGCLRRACRAGSAGGGWRPAGAGLAARHGAGDGADAGAAIGPARLGRLRHDRADHGHRRHWPFQQHGRRDIGARGCGAARTGHAAS